MAEKILKNEQLSALSFEDALARLEALVAKMEAGQLPLEEMIRNFENGTMLVNECRSRLNRFEKKIELLTRDDGREGQWAEFEPDNPRAVSAGLEEAPESAPTPPAPRRAAPPETAPEPDELF